MHTSIPFVISIPSQVTLSLIYFTSWTIFPFHVMYLPPHFHPNSRNSSLDPLFYFLYHSPRCTHIGCSLDHVHNDLCFYPILFTSTNTHFPHTCSLYSLPLISAQHFIFHMYYFLPSFLPFLPIYTWNGLLHLTFYSPPFPT